MVNKRHILFVLFLAGLFTMQLRSVLRANPIQTTAPTDRYIALMGNAQQIESVMMPYAHETRLLRTQHHSHLVEAPISYTADFTATPAIYLYEIKMPDRVLTVRHELETLTQNHPLVAINKQEIDNLYWLSYMPKEVLVSGECTLAQNPSGLINGLEWDGTIISLTKQAGFCVARHQIVDGSTVLDKIGYFDSVAIEPNYLLVGGGPQGHITGSPGGSDNRDVPAPDPLPTTQTGDGVFVVVFDTVVANTPLYNQTFTSLPATLPRSELIEPHGTLVTSLIEQMAPEAEYHIVQALSPMGYGDLYDLLFVLQREAADYSALQNNSLGVVFNLSLEMEQPILAGLSDDVLALDLLLTELELLEIVVTAASGNGSAYGTIPRPMSAVGQHEFVLGVAALPAYADPDDPLSCYANIGDVGMFGGGVSQTELADGDCIEQTVALCQSDPKLCAVGRDPFANTTGYSAGFGTSYATPLVAGMVVQAIDYQGELGWPTPDCIRQNIRLNGSVDNRFNPMRQLPNPYETSYRYRFCDELTLGDGSQFLPLVKRNE